MTNIFEKIKEIEALDKDNKANIKSIIEGGYIRLIFNDIYELGYDPMSKTHYFWFYLNDYSEKPMFHFYNFTDKFINGNFDLILDTTNFLKENREKILNILSEVEDDNSNK